MSTDLNIVLMMSIKAQVVLDLNINPWDLEPLNEDG